MNRFRKKPDGPRCQCGHGLCMHNTYGGHSCAKYPCHCQQYIGPLPGNDPVAEMEEWAKQVVGRERGTT